MMKIGLLSDTHSYIDNKITNFFSSVDEIWHAGDIGNLSLFDQLSKFKPLRAVYGNIDGHELRVVCPKNQRFICEGMDIFMTHIGGYPGKYFPEVLDILKKQPPALFICGHSHILKVMFDKKMGFMFINPGAAGISGFHKVRTAVRFSIHEGQLQNMEVLEIDRGK